MGKDPVASGTGSLPARPVERTDAEVRPAVRDDALLRTAVGLADRLLGSNPRPTDTYDPRRSATEHLDDMRRFVVFRPGRAFEVGAMGERTPADPRGRPGGEEPARVIRDGRMIVIPSRTGGGEEASRAGSSESPARANAAANTPEARAAQAAANAAALRGALGSLTREELSMFERIFMAHFEGGIPIGEKLEKGQFKFLPKTEKAWAEFFQKFLPFTLEKKVKLGDVEMLVFRGLVKGEQAEQAKGQAGQKAFPLFLVSDMKFLDGKTDKFARLQIQGQDLAQQMGEHQAGDLLGQTALTQILERMGQDPEGFTYLSLSHRIVNPDMADPKNPLALAYRTPEQMKDQAIREGTRDVSQGIALSARTEQLVAEKLDINLKQGRDLGAIEGRSREVPGAPGGPELGGLFAGKKKRRGLFSGEGDESAGGSAYIPWWLTPNRPKQIKGKPRWWVPFLYFLAASGAGLAAVYAFRHWMSR